MSKSRTFAWMAWVIASLFYAYQYVLRVMPNIMMDSIIEQFNIDVVTFGQFSGVYYIGYSLMHLPIGMLLDRFGPKKIMPFFILMTVVGLLPIIFADSWVYPIIGRLLIGMGSSAAILSTFKIIRLYFTEEKFTRMLSFSVTIGLIGAIYGGGPVNYLFGVLGYKIVVELFVLLGLILAVFAYFAVPTIKLDHPSTITSDIKEVFSNGKVIFICLCAGLMVGPMEGFADVWGTGFLKQVYGLEGTVAASLPSLIFVGMCFGGPILSVIAEKTNRYLGTIIVAGILMVFGFVFLVEGQMDIRSMSVMFALIGMCSAYQIIAIYKASTYVKEHVVGLTTAIANMIIMVFGYLFHTIIGWVVHFMGGPNDALAYVKGITVIPVALVLGVLGFCILVSWEKIKKNKSV